MRLVDEIFVSAAFFLVTDSHPTSSCGVPINATNRINFITSDAFSYHLGSVHWKLQNYSCFSSLFISAILSSFALVG